MIAVGGPPMRLREVCFVAFPISVIFVSIGFTVPTTGCGSDDESTGSSPACVGDCECNGDVCTCKAGGKCTFGGTATATAGEAGLIDGGAAPPDNATFKCDSKNTCDSTCG